MPPLPDLADATWELLPGVPRPETWPGDRVELVKSNPFRSISRVRVGDGLDVHLKHCRPVGLRAWLREWLRPAKAKLEYRKAMALAERGVPTLEALGVGTAGRWLPGDSFLITRTLDGAVPLGAYLAAASPRQRHRIAVALGAFFARLHRAGVTHPDPHPGN